MSEDTRNSRKVIQGRVVSDKMDKPSLLSVKHTRIILYTANVFVIPRNTKLMMKIMKLMLAISSGSWKLVLYQLQSVSAYLTSFKKLLLSSLLAEEN